MKIKICGITNKEDALMCERAGADALGFIFYNKSPRYVAPLIVSKISKELSPLTIKIGVFVNSTREEIEQIFNNANLNMVQLHGDETAEFFHSIKFPKIKAFRIDEKFNFDIINKFRNSNILLDAYSKNTYGGSGINFNWELIPDNIKSRIILAGGISKENLDTIFNKVKPAAIDVSSSLEISPGKKDETKIKEFMKTYNKFKEMSW